MLDPETFLTELYVAADTFDKAQLPPAPQPGPAPALSRAEVITLALFSQHQRFPSEAEAYRYADHHLRPLFPTLPSRAQFNRLLRAQADAITTFAVHLGHTPWPPVPSAPMKSSMAPGSLPATPTGGVPAGCGGAGRYRLVQSPRLL